MAQAHLAWMSVYLCMRLHDCYMLGFFILMLLVCLPPSCSLSPACRLLLLWKSYL